MKTPLEELANKITPLPWPDGTREGEAKTSLWVDDFQYARHCANHFQQVVKTLAMVKRRFEETEKDYQEDVEYIEVCDTLKAAQEVEV